MPSGYTADPVGYREVDLAVLGLPDDLRRLCEERGADTVLVARGGYDTSEALRRVSVELEGSNVEMVLVPSLIDVAGPRIQFTPVACHSSTSSSTRPAARGACSSVCWT